MSHNWPIVLLGQVLKHRSEFVTIDDTKTYKRCRVQLHAQGIVLRDKVEGAAIKTKDQQACRTGDFLVAEIDAKMGGFGIVPPDLEEAIVSSHYFLFEVDEDQLDRRFLDFYIRTHDFRVQVAAQGSTNYAAIRPAHVLGYQMPLPPMAEQRRIVARIEELAGRIAEANKLRAATLTEMEALLRSEMHRCFSLPCIPRVPLHSVCTEIIDTIHSDPICESEGVPCVRSPDVADGRLNLQAALKTSEDEYRRRTVRGEPQVGDLVYCRQGGGTGRAALVETACKFSLGQAMMLLRPDRARIDPSFFLYQLLSPLVLEDQLVACFIGTASPRVNIGALRQFKIALPSRADQRGIVERLTALVQQDAKMRFIHERSRTEIAALLPAILDKAFRGEL